jgi:hypothetical protein
MRPIHEIRHGAFFKVDGKYYTRVMHIDEHEYRRDHPGKIFGYEINDHEGQWFRDTPLYRTSEAVPSIILDPDTEVEWAHWSKFHCDHCHEEWYAFNSPRYHPYLCHKCKKNKAKFEAYQKRRTNFYWWPMMVMVMVAVSFSGSWPYTVATIAAVILADLHGRLIAERPFG